MKRQKISNTGLVNCAYVTKNTNVILKKIIKMVKKPKRNKSQL